MRIIDSPTNLLVVGIACVVLYSLGQYGRSRHREYFKVVGFGGTALVLLKLFWSMCPAQVFGYLFPMLVAALASPVIIWVFRTIKNKRNRQQQFSFSRRKTSADKLIEEEIGQDTAPESHEPRINSPVPH